MSIIFIDIIGYMNLFVKCFALKPYFAFKCDLRLPSGGGATIAYSGDFDALRDR